MWSRRVALGGLAAAVSVPALGGDKPRLKPIRRIACEEGYSLPELIDAVDAFMAKHADREPGLAALIGPGGKFPRMPQLLDPARRIADMDRSGVTMQLLLLNSPGVQIFDAAQGVELAKLANDRAAEWVRAHPTRLAALAAFAPQDPDKAAQELERAVRSLGATKEPISINRVSRQYWRLPKRWMCRYISTRANPGRTCSPPIWSATCKVQSGAMRRKPAFTRSV
jgi:5-carboxyvanillate decarboxylase